jgi:hypothetical protein
LETTDIHPSFLSVNTPRFDINKEKLSRKGSLSLFMGDKINRDVFETHLSKLNENAPAKERFLMAGRAGARSRLTRQDPLSCRREQL